MGGRIADTVLLLLRRRCRQQHVATVGPGTGRGRVSGARARSRGFGSRPLEPAPFSHLRDVEELVDGPLAVVGNSLGGRVALELALHRPDLVERLMVIAPGMPGWEWSEATRDGWAAQEEA
jgi:pimeloyl-ACP methyl ester carboxylesterase